MSDFHFGKAPEREKERIELLAKWIKDSRINVKYIVFTGDVIDARTVSQKCVTTFLRDNIDAFVGLIPMFCDNDGLIKDKKPNELSRDEECEVLFQAIKENLDTFLSHIEGLGEDKVDAYNKILKETSNNQMDEAIKIVCNFLNYIGLPYDRFISCCGNHDRIRYLRSEKKQFLCDDEHHIHEESFVADYDPYVRFCDAINKKLSYKTTVYPHDGLNFIIANSNWRTPVNQETNNMCIHCGEVMRILLDLRNQQGFDRNSNIFIAHKPFDDICENAKFPYGKEQELTTREIIEQTTAMFLHGDKHSYVVKDKNWLKEFMCGTPLAFDGVRYNLIDHDPKKGVQTSKFILFSNGKWNQIPILEFMDSAFALSNPYIKKYAFSLLAPELNPPINWQGAIKLMQSTIDSGRIQLIEQLFYSCVKLYGEKKEILEKDAFLEQFIMTVDDSNSWLAMGVKGEPGSGKSTLLSIEYLYLLRKFYSGDCKYIPFYFDVDSLSHKIEIELAADGSEREIDLVIDKFVHYFKSYLDSAITLSEQYGVPICLFVDGLDTENMLTDTGLALEAQLYTYLESRLTGQNHKCIMGLNTHDNLLFEKSFAQWKQFEHALFFNPICIVPYKKEERYPGFLEAYLQLTKDNKAIKFDDVLKKLRRISIDLNFLYRYDSLLGEDTSEIDSWNVMRKQVVQMNQIASVLFKDRDMQKINHAAYLMMIKGCSYQAICEDEIGSFVFSDFIKLRNNPEIAEYLVARHYIDELRKYTNSSEAIPSDSILYCFITRNLGVKIRLQMDVCGFQFKALKRFVERHGPELTGHLSSTIVYLVGHSKKYGNAELVENVQTQTIEENDFFRHCAKRSRELALIACEDNYTELSNNFIKELINDAAFRSFNRSYQLHYYQDLTDLKDFNGTTWRVDKSKGVGFDFSNCFLVLVSKLDYSFDTDNPYPMMEIDLYTLCDLVYSRLQMFGDKRALFYSSANNQEGDSLAVAILQRVVSLIDRYELTYRQKRGIDNLVQTYFSFMRAQFVDVCSVLEKKPGDSIEKPFVPISKDLKDIIYLLNQPRVGWNISKAGTVQKKKRPKYAPRGALGMSKAQWGEYKPILETIGQHVLESMYIAQLYLPESLAIEGYSKSSILSMLLMSEIGKLAIQEDYTPLYSGAREFLLKEKDSLNQFLLRGAIDGYANFTELFGHLTVVGSLQDSPADINMRICQEIKQIQMEYKFYSLHSELDFEYARIESFMKDFVEPDTQICKDIRKRLIFENPDFAEFLTTK